MESLTSKDTETLNQSIQKLYTLHNFTTFGVDALSILDQLVPSNIPNFHSTRIQKRQVLHTFLTNSSGITPEMEKVRYQHFGQHPIAQRMPQTLNGAYKISDFMNQKEFHCLEGLYQQFLRLLGSEDEMTFFCQIQSQTVLIILLSKMQHSLGFHFIALSATSQNAIASS